MNEKIVFDSSAVIALFAKEKGFEVVKKHLKNAIISSVNVAELYKYCIDVQSLTKKDCKEIFAMSGIKIIDFSEEEALITAQIYENTKEYGLSLGDRACISLAMIKNCSVLTCDKIWAKVKLDVKFILAR